MKGMNETKGDDGVRGKRRRIGGDLIAEFPVVMSTVDHPLLFSSLPVLSRAFIFIIYQLSQEPGPNSLPIQNWRIFPLEIYPLPSSSFSFSSSSFPSS